MLLRNIFITTLLVWMWIPAFGQDAGSTTPPPSERVVIHRHETKPSVSRPHAPSNQFITMDWYAEQGICTFDLTEDAQFITVEFTETESLWTVTETVPTSEPVLYISLTPGTYTITCTTDNGNTYSGEFIF
jgi:hypothetical protein